jgi:OOP family OmpA-OmpF porin
MVIRLFLLFIFVNNVLVAQNSDFDYISNGSFEAYDSCPPNLSTPGIYCFNVCNNWWIPYYGTSDYFNECFNSNPYNYSAPFFPIAGSPLNFFGYQNPFEGKGYIGLYLNEYLWRNYREYAQTQLLKPLIKNHRYRLRMYVSLCDGCIYKSRNFGAVFGKNKVEDYSSLISISNEAIEYAEFIDDSVNWKLIDLTYVAKGDEQFMTLGLFRDTLETTNIIATQIDSGSSKVSYIFIDSVSIKETFNVEFPNILTPNNDGLNDAFNIFFPEDWTNISFIIYNRWGAEIYKVEETKEVNWPTKSKEKYNDGVYFYTLTYINELNQREAQKGFFLLLTNN